MLIVVIFGRFLGVALLWVSSLCWCSTQAQCPEEPHPLLLCQITFPLQSALLHTIAPGFAWHRAVPCVWLRAVSSI